jgi:putative DNA primase/helicase
MSAEIIAKALGGCRAGAGWVAHCPAHDDRTPSLSVRDFTDGKVLLRCHAGCEQERVIAALRTRNLWTGFRLKLLRAARPVVERQPEDNDVRRSKDGLAISQSATPPGGALVPANGEHGVVASENGGARKQ